MFSKTFLHTIVATLYSYSAWEMDKLEVAIGGWIIGYNYEL